MARPEHLHDAFLLQELLEGCPRLCQFFLHFLYIFIFLELAIHLVRHCIIRMDNYIIFWLLLPPKALPKASTTPPSRFGWFAFGSQHCFCG